MEWIEHELRRRDVLFKEVPISVSDESADLCQAHMQRVIAQKLATNIWQPFSSEPLCTRPELARLLTNLHKHVAKSSYKGSRQEVFWRIQTSRACRFLDWSEVGSTDTEAQAVVTRIGQTFEAVTAAIGPLIDPEALSGFKTELSEIIQLSIAVWDQAAVDEKFLEAQVALEPSLYHDCRSEKFDPRDENSKPDAAITDQRPNMLTSSSSPSSELFVLFPRIRMHHPAYEDWSSIMEMPGSFPQSDGASQNQDISIVHKGRALATTSKLVRDGRAELAEREERMKTALAKANEEDRQKRRNRRQSTASSRATLVQSGHENFAPEHGSLRKTAAEQTIG